MIIVNAIFLVLTTSPSIDAFNSFHELSDQLDDHIEWIDHRGASRITKNRAQKLLKQYAKGIDKNAFSIRHISDWKNNKCFRIIHLKSQKAGYRIFFQCAKSDTKNNLVTKIKITAL